MNLSGWTEVIMQSDGGYICRRREFGLLALLRKDGETAKAYEAKCASAGLIRGRLDVFPFLLP